MFQKCPERKKIPSAKPTQAPCPLAWGDTKLKILRQLRAKTKTLKCPKSVKKSNFTWKQKNWENWLNCFQLKQDYFFVASKFVVASPDRDPAEAKSRCRPGWERSTHHPSCTQILELLVTGKKEILSIEMRRNKRYTDKNCCIDFYLHSEHFFTNRGKAGHLEDQILLWRSIWLIRCRKGHFIFSSTKPRPPRQDGHKSLTWGPEATDSGILPAIFQSTLSRRHKISSSLMLSTSEPQCP